MTEPTEPIPTYKLPYETCDKFRAVNNRTEALTQLDVRLGLEQVMDDPQFVLTANLRGQRTIAPYILELARFARAVQTGDTEGQVLDFGENMVPDEVQNVLNGISPEQLPLF